MTEYPRAASNGTRKRHWFVLLGPNPWNTLNDKRGRVRWFGSYETARKAMLNAA